MGSQRSFNQETLSASNIILTTFFFSYNSKNLPDIVSTLVVIVVLQEMVVAFFTLGQIAMSPQSVTGARRKSSPSSQNKLSKGPRVLRFSREFSVLVCSPALPSPLENLSKSTQNLSMMEPVMKPKAGPMEVAASRRPGKKGK